VPHDHVDNIYPAIDVDHYTPAAAPEGRFTLLFASSPADPSEIDARGVGLLIELARLRPDLDVVVLWRQWGDVAEARRVIDRRSPPPNFRLEHRDARDMAAVYQSVHATACFFDAGVGKSAPNSVVEGLATGRPALLTDTCGMADIVGAWQAGVVCPREITALAGAVDQLKRGYSNHALQARRLAEQEFDSRRALARYAALYERLGCLAAA
jgi:glycosyltransferase involved in cell wall biosynthesis